LLLKVIFVKLILGKYVYDIFYNYIMKELGNYIWKKIITRNMVRKIMSTFIKRFRYDNIIINLVLLTDPCI